MYGQLSWLPPLTQKRAKGSAEEKLTDNAPKPAKIRPMRVEMHRTKSLDDLYNCEFITTTIKINAQCIATDSGETP